MGLVFVLLGDNTTSLADPAEGEFTACGDFDRLLPLATELPFERGFDLEVLGRAEAFEDVDFTSVDMPGLIRDVASLRLSARPGPEVHGLDRLRVMAQQCAEAPESKIRSLGD